MKSSLSEILNGDGHAEPQSPIPGVWVRFNVPDHVFRYPMIIGEAGPSNNSVSPSPAEWTLVVASTYFKHGDLRSKAV